MPIELLVFIIVVLSFFLLFLLLEHQNAPEKLSNHLIYTPAVIILLLLSWTVTTVNRKHHSYLIPIQEVQNGTNQIQFIPLGNNVKSLESLHIYEHPTLPRNIEVTVYEDHNWIKPVRRLEFKLEQP